MLIVCTQTIHIVRYSSWSKISTWELITILPSYHVFFGTIYVCTFNSICYIFWQTDWKYSFELRLRFSWDFLKTHIEGQRAPGCLIFKSAFVFEVRLFEVSSFSKTEPPAMSVNSQLLREPASLAITMLMLCCKFLVFMFWCVIS